MLVISEMGGGLMAIVGNESQIFCLRIKLCNSREILSVNCASSMSYMDVNCGLTLLQRLKMRDIERVHRFCVKFIQSLPRMSRTIIV